MAEADGHDETLDLGPVVDQTYQNLTVGPVVEQTYETLALGQVEDQTYGTLLTKTNLLRLLRSDIRRNKCFGAGLGVFCVVLALLNVAVPLHLHQSNMVERQQLMSRLEQIQNTNLNLTEKKGQLETSLDLLETSYDKLETRCDKLETRCDKLETVRYEIPTKEREQFETRITNLTDEWTTKITNLTKERDELKMRLCLLTLTELVCESPGWQKFDSGCYYISTERNTWEASRQWCRDHQSDLVVIKSKEEQDFVVSLVPKDRTKQWVWLGLTDSAVEGSFMWVDGTPLTTPTYWMPGQPDGEPSFSNAVSDCVSYYDGSLSVPPTPGWYDVQCSSATYWMCERSLC